METVVLGGVTYTRALSAAEEFGYTSDYVGQLCRSKKVDARLVGRAWYVNTDSIKDYRQKKHTKRKTRINEKSTRKPLKKRINVTPRAHKTTLRVISNQQSSTTAKIPISYETDEADLLPRLRPLPNTSSATKTIAVHSDTESESLLPTQEIHAPEKPLKIKVQSKKVSTSESRLVAEPLPTVSLSGGLSVEDAPDMEPYEILEEGQEKAVETTVKESEKRSKITLFLIKILFFFSWPLRIVWRFLLFILLRPAWRLFTAIGSRLKKLITCLKIPLFLRKKKVKTVKTSTAPAFVPQAVKVSETDVSDHHHRVQFWSLVVSAFLTGLLVLTVGTEFLVIDGSAKRMFFVERDIFEMLISR